METLDMYNTIGIKEHGVFNCYDYVILTTRLKCPCCYILLKQGDPFSDIDTASEDDIDIPVHGGCTYFQKAETFLSVVPIKPFLEPRVVIGWDYAHFKDYSPIVKEGKKWTLDELRDEVRQAINYLVDLKGWRHYE